MMLQMKTRIFALAIVALTVSGAVAASPEAPATGPDLPPQGSVKLSQLIAQAEERAGFFAIKSISYSSNEYEVIYYMDDGAEVRLNLDAKTGDVRPPKSGGLFGN